VGLVSPTMRGWETIEESSAVPRSTCIESMPTSISREEDVVSSWPKHRRSGEIELLNKSTGIPREEVVRDEHVELERADLRSLQSAAYM
jgi:hypothetical protein